MAQTKSGAELVAAKKSGVSAEEYRRRIANGEKRCSTCKLWLRVVAFGKDATRYDRLSPVCSDCKRAKSRAKWIPKPRVSKKGQRFAAIRDGDREQARYRANHLIKIGRLENPNKLPCFDCGHRGEDRRHEYDHFAGYSAERQECVQAVCTVCHAKRSRQRGELVQQRSKGKFTKKGGS